MGKSFTEFMFNMRKVDNNWEYRDAESGEYIAVPKDLGNKYVKHSTLLNVILLITVPVLISDFVSGQKLLPMWILIPLIAMGLYIIKLDSTISKKFHKTIKQLNKQRG